MDAKHDSMNVNAALTPLPLVASLVGCTFALELLHPGASNLLLTLSAGVVLGLAYGTIIYRLASLRKPDTPKMWWYLIGLSAVVGFMSGTLTGAMATLAQGG